MWQHLTRQDKATMLFALQYLQEHFAEAGAALAESIFFSKLVGEEVRPPADANDVQRLLQLLLRNELPAEQLKVAYVLDDDDLDFKTGDTLQDVHDAGGSLLDGCMEPVAALFKVDGDDRWLVGTVEFVVNEANPDFVRDRIEEHLADIEDEADAATEAAFLRTELARLPPRKEHSDPPPATEPMTEAEAAAQCALCRRSEDRMHKLAAWLINRRGTASERHGAAQGLYPEWAVARAKELLAAQRSPWDEETVLPTSEEPS